MIIIWKMLVNDQLYELVLWWMMLKDGKTHGWWWFMNAYDIVSVVNLCFTEGWSRPQINSKRWASLNDEDPLPDSVTTTRPPRIKRYAWPTSRNPDQILQRFYVCPSNPCHFPGKGKHYAHLAIISSMATQLVFLRNWWFWHGKTTRAQNGSIHQLRAQNCKFPYNNTHVWMVGVPILFIHKPTCDLVVKSRGSQNVVRNTAPFWREKALRKALSFQCTRPFEFCNMPCSHLAD